MSGWGLVTVGSTYTQSAGKSPLCLVLSLIPWAQPEVMTCSPVSWSSRMRSPLAKLRNVESSPTNEDSLEKDKQNCLKIHHHLIWEIFRMRITRFKVSLAFSVPCPEKKDNDLTAGLQRKWDFLSFMFLYCPFLSIMYDPLKKRLYSPIQYVYMQPNNPYKWDFIRIERVGIDPK